MKKKCGPICSWQRIKKVLIDLWFPNDYYDLLDYTSVDYKSVYSYENQYVHNIKGQNQNYHNQVHVSSKGKSLMVEKKQPISRETFEMVKKGQDLQQVVELKLEKKNELIVEDHRNQEIVIIENIIEDPLEVKDEDESITHNP